MCLPIVQTDAALLEGKETPTPEHWLSLYFALGASTGPGERLHHSIDFKVLAMDAYSFN